jgi:GNAT superfamily N-acetyltransferase
MPNFKIYDKDKLPKDVEIPMQHASENDLPEGEWEENEFNYRLNTASSIYYAVSGKKVIGHLGLNSDDKVEGVYVDPEYRGKGTALALYEFAVNDLDTIWDKPSEQDPGGKAIWEALERKHPENVDLGKKKFIYRKGSYMKKDKELITKLVRKVKAKLTKISKDISIPKDKAHEVIKILGGKPWNMKRISEIILNEEERSLQIESDVYSMTRESMEKYNINEVHNSKNGLIVWFLLNSKQIADIKKLSNSEE